MLDVPSVGRDNVAFGVAIAPSSSSELSPSLLATSLGGSLSKFGGQVGQSIRRATFARVF